jgi:hypothetical protein
MNSIGELITATNIFIYVLTIEMYDKFKKKG